MTNIKYFKISRQEDRVDLELSFSDEAWDNLASYQIKKMFMEVIEEEVDEWKEKNMWQRSARICLNDRKIQFLKKMFDGEAGLRLNDISFADGIQRWVEFYRDGIVYYSTDDRDRLVRRWFEAPLHFYFDELLSIEDRQEVDLDLPALTEKDKVGNYFRWEVQERAKAALKAAKKMARKDFMESLEYLENIGNNRRGYKTPVICTLGLDQYWDGKGHPSFLFYLTLYDWDNESCLGNPRPIMNGGIIYNRSSDRYSIHT